VELVAVCDYAGLDGGWGCFFFRLLDLWMWLLWWSLCEEIEEQERESTLSVLSLLFPLLVKLAVGSRSWKLLVGLLRLLAKLVMSLWTFMMLPATRITRFRQSLVLCSLPLPLRMHLQLAELLMPAGMSADDVAELGEGLSDSVSKISNIKDVCRLKI
jgi:hypothetical protein